MKIQLILLVFFLSLSTSYCQTSLAGSLTDTKTGEPLMYAYVSLYQNGTLITGTITDLAGDYSLKDLKPGTYDLVFSYIGYKTQKTSKVKLVEGVTYIDEKLLLGFTLDIVVVSALDTREFWMDCGGSHGYFTIERESESEKKIEDKIKHSENLVYPNPASSYFNIKSERKIKDASIFNLSGQLVKTLNKGQTEVDVSDLIAGTYFLVITEGEVVQTEKIVIVRD